MVVWITGSFLHPAPLKCWEFRGDTRKRAFSLRDCCSLCPGSLGQNRLVRGCAQSHWFSLGALAVARSGVTVLMLTLSERPGEVLGWKVGAACCRDFRYGREQLLSESTEQGQPSWAPLGSLQNPKPRVSVSWFCSWRTVRNPADLSLVTGWFLL